MTMSSYIFSLLFVFSPLLAFAQADVSGEITLPSGLPICNVLVELVIDGGVVVDQDISEADGSFLFTAVPTGVDYTLRFHRPDPYSNGLSTLDMVFMAGKILGIADILPYDYWAGDVNGSLTMTTLDRLLVAKVILGIDTPMTMPWAFDEPGLVFADNEIELPAFTENVEDIQVIGVKRGDMNGNVNPNCE